VYIRGRRDQRSKGANKTTGAPWRGLSIYILHIYTHTHVHIRTNLYYIRGRRDERSNCAGERTRVPCLIYTHIHVHIHTHLYHIRGRRDQRSKCVGETTRALFLISCASNLRQVLSTHARVHTLELTRTHPYFPCSYTKGIFLFVYKRENTGCNLLQGGEDPQDALNCILFSAKEPLITGLFCGKWPMSHAGIRHVTHVNASCCTSRCTYEWVTVYLRKWTNIWRFEIMWPPISFVCQMRT